MSRRVGLCLAFRDMWQSSCSCFPSVSQLREMAYAIAAMGCFDRVEASGGAFEQVCLMQGENPNRAVREFCAPLNAAGIKTQMLERGLNALRLSPLPADIRELMFKVKASQGVDISRSFCGLNDHRNFRLSIEYAKAAGMVSQVALPIADSPVHTIDHYMRVVGHAVEYGCDEICVKDMSGQGDPSFIAELIRRIKAAYQGIFVQYHSHCSCSSSRESLLEAVRAGADCVDVALGQLAGGAGHPEVLEVVQWLRSDGFAVKDIDMEAYRRLVSFVEDSLSAADSSAGSSRVMTDGARDDADAAEILRAAGLPGGMMPSLLNELSAYHSAVNRALDSLSSASSVSAGLPVSSDLVDSPKLTFRQFLVRFSDELKSVWPALGYPPMVTPFSQYVANAALSNLLSQAKGQPRWSGLTSDVWNMILGRMGQLPGELDSSLVALAEEKGLAFYDGDPQQLYPDALDLYRAKMLAEGWSAGPDDEELLEFAMHESQYRDYMSAHFSALPEHSGIQVSASVSVSQDNAVYAAIAMALHEYGSKEIIS